MKIDWVAELRSSLNAKLIRMLSRPLIARVEGDDGTAEVASPDEPAAMRAMRLAGAADASPRAAWRESDSGDSVQVRIEIDYLGEWRGCEKEVLQTLASAVESPVTFLTDEQLRLLRASPREFLELSPRPETSDLIGYEVAKLGGGERVVALTLAAAPATPALTRHLAIVPNLIPLERQLDALELVAQAADDGPLGPLRALLGACELAQPEAGEIPGLRLLESERLDEYQRACIEKAMATPHFGVIEGPPGAGKTTVIAAILRRVVAQGGRALVVSPTHVAVDNVVEKLVGVDPTGDKLHPLSLPVRYAAKPTKLSREALRYWVGPKRQERLSEIASRVGNRLKATVPFAEGLLKRVSADGPKAGPLTRAVASCDSVICGTPIGILSCDDVKRAPAARFDVLVVDEVSKMTVPEFLAIAVKARRWIVVGDPAQLPPYNDAVESGVTLDDVLPPLLELACSVGAVLEREKPALRAEQRIVVVSSEPGLAADAIRAHLGEVFVDRTPSVGVVAEGAEAGIIVCGAHDVAIALERCVERSAEVVTRPTRVLVERGLSVARPAWASGHSLVEPRSRASATIFEGAFTALHTLPWAHRAGHRLPSADMLKGLRKSLPSHSALWATGVASKPDAVSEAHRDLRRRIAGRFALNAISLYDWLARDLDDRGDLGLPLGTATADAASLRRAVLPYVGTLKKQYRMHPSLSFVPRSLFYFGDALLDGNPAASSVCLVQLQRVLPKDTPGEWNSAEIDAVRHLVAAIQADERAAREPSSVMVITPYREQEARLRMALSLANPGGGAALSLEVCTLDRCQGREADYVLISLVRGRATPFLDMPNRWNVALTRARRGLVIVGDIDAFLGEAARARRELGRGVGSGRGPRPGESRPRMSLLARILEAYQHQLDASASRRAGGGAR